MADNVKDLFKQALKYTSDGKLEKAIEAYQAIVKKSPKDTRVLNNLGDIYLKKKMNNEAAATFNTLAQIYEDDGYALRAIAICQKVLKIVPDSTAAKARMAELYTRQGLVAEARGQYLELANHFDKKGQIKDALEIFRRLADLDPTNLAVRVKLGNMFQKEKMNQEAAAEWAKAGKGYLQGGQAAEGRKLLEKAIQADPQEPTARVLMAGEEFKNGRIDQTIELLQPLFESSAADLDSLKMYAMALLKQQRYAEASEVLKAAVQKDPDSIPLNENLGLALLKAGSLDQASEHLTKMMNQHLKENRWEKAERLALELRLHSPDDPQILQKLADIYVHTGSTESLVSTYTALADLYQRKGLKKNVLGVYEKLRELQPGNEEWERKAAEFGGSVEPAPAAKKAAPAPPPAPPVEEDLGALVESMPEALEEEVEVEVDQEIPAIDACGEAENLMKRGRFKDAEAHLQKILMQEPALEPLRLLKELYRLQGKSRAFIETCFDLAAFLQQSGQKEESIQEYQDILVIDQRNQRAKEALADLVVELGTPGPGMEEAEPQAPPETAEFKEEEVLFDIPEEPEVPGAGFPPSLEDLAVPPAPVGLEEVAARTETVPSAAATSDTSELFAEAEFYRQQGLLEEARKLYQAVVALDPGRQDAVARLAEITLTEKPEEKKEEGITLGEQDLADFERSLDAGLPQPKPEVRFSVAQSGSQTAEQSEEFQEFLTDLKDEIEEPVSPPASTVFEDESLKEIFQEFQRGVRENLSAEDYETHYNLGIAYKEMGLHEEAIAEFRLAGQSPAFYVDAASMIALIHRDRREWVKAIESMESALNHIGPEETEPRKGLLWEMAEVYEAQGDTQKALELFLSVQRLDGSYRTIGEKLKQLGASAAAEGPKGAEKAPAKKAPVTPAAKKSKNVSFI